AGLEHLPRICLLQRIYVRLEKLGNGACLPCICVLSYAYAWLWNGLAKMGSRLASSKRDLRVFHAYTWTPMPMHGLVNFESRMNGLGVGLAWLA
ncbi:hypothetical protein PIB30_076043, partial [Stylosanthes scabra]|nr:hypothetical protein [Stylosanthes scabra]